MVAAGYPKYEIQQSSCLIVALANATDLVGLKRSNVLVDD
jgi:hypothetical protein